MTALVTGASGGLGSAIAAALAHAGHDVAVHWRSDRAGAEATAAAVRATGRVAHLVQRDLAVTEAAHLDHLVADLLDDATTALGPLDGGEAGIVLPPGVGTALQQQPQAPGAEPDARAS